MVTRGQAEVASRGQHHRMPIESAPDAGITRSFTVQENK